MRMPLRVPAGRMAALFIDLQEEHRRDPRYLVDGFEHILEHVARLQQAARTSGITVLHAEYIVDAADARPFNPIAVDGTPVFSAKGDPLTAICADVAPVDGETVFTKSQPSVFGSGELGALLTSAGIEWLLVAGVWTEACVDATVKDAIRAGLRVILVKDACGSGTAMMHETAILNLANRLYGGAVADTARACALMGGESAEVWVAERPAPILFDYDSARAAYRAL